MRFFKQNNPGMTQKTRGVQNSYDSKRHSDRSQCGTVLILKPVNAEKLGEILGWSQIPIVK